MVDKITVLPVSPRVLQILPVSVIPIIYGGHSSSVIVLFGVLQIFPVSVIPIIYGGHSSSVTVPFRVLQILPVSVIASIYGGHSSSVTVPFGVLQILPVSVIPIIYGGHSSSVTGFSPSTSDSSCQCNSIISSFSLISLIHLSPTLENLRKRQLPYYVTVLFLYDELVGVFTASGLHF
jgi:hypothetical protein